MNKLFLIPLILTLLLIPNIFAISNCWSEIRCTNSGAIASGTIIYPDYDDSQPTTSEEYCSIDGITIPATSDYNHIKIEIHQPGYNGATLTPEYPIQRDSYMINQGIKFKLGKETTPTYVYCVDLYWASPQNSLNGMEIDILNTWSASYSSAWYDFINPISKGNSLNVNDIVTGTNTNTNIFSTKLDVNNYSFGTQRIDANNYAFVSQAITTSGSITNTNAGSQTITVAGSTTAPVQITGKLGNPISLDFNTNTGIAGLSNLLKIDLNVYSDANKNLNVSGIKADVNIGSINMPTDYNINASISGTTAAISYTNLPANSANPGIYTIALIFTILGFLGLLFTIGVTGKEWF